MEEMAADAVSNLVRSGRLLLAVLAMARSSGAGDMMRDANAPTSLSLYWMCGLVWYHHGTAKEFIGILCRFWVAMRSQLKRL